MRHRSSTLALAATAYCLTCGAALRIGTNRRAFLARSMRQSSAATVAISAAIAAASGAHADDLKADPLAARLGKGLDGLNQLLDTWDESTTDCTFADVDRSLLEGKNKEKLLKAATTNALFDKTNAVMSCKRNAKAVRSYLGLTSSETPLYGAATLMQKAVKRVAPDDIEAYLTAVEEWQQAISAADSTARLSAVGDYGSFEKSKPGEDDAGSYLEQSKSYVTQARDALEVIVAALQAPQ